jgi:heat shock protein HtpX
MTETEPAIVHSFTIETELTKNQMLALPKFIREHMAFGQVPDIRMTGMVAEVGPHGHFMQFKAGPNTGAYEATVRVWLDRPIRVEIRSSMGRDEAFEGHLHNVLLMVEQFFEEEVRKSTLYMAFVPGSPKTAELRTKRSPVRALFSGNMINLFMLSILIGAFVFLFFGKYAPILMIGLMLALVLSAGRIFAAGSPWRITPKNREVILVQHQVPEGQLTNYVQDYKEKIRAAKKKAYDMYASCPENVCSPNIAQVFRDAGIPSEDKDFLVRRLDIYGLVERVAKRFGIRIPTIVISPDPRPNAAATGFTRQLGTMIITMGLLMHLEEEEIEVVVGHELSHLRAGDPIALFMLIGTEYLARVYLYSSYILPFFIPYLIVVFWLIFFFGKFLESRADLEAGIITGKPLVMAESLKKIGFRRLVLSERFLEPGVSRFGEWLRFDPHPPLYFRIQQLEDLDLKNPPKHTLLSSMRAVLSGVAHSGASSQEARARAPHPQSESVRTRGS